jgi:hypothetical protein
MRKALLGIVIALFALHAYQRVREPARVEPTRLTGADLRFVGRPDPSAGVGVKVDGNHDGIPCEKQWCRD